MKTPPRQCSCCGKTEADVDVLVTGPSFLICDECIVQAQGVVDDMREARIEKKLGASVAKAMRIKTV